MGFNKNVQPLFIDLHTSVNTEEGELFNLILSPSFYWVKRTSLPVKSLRDVKRLLPSLFEDTTPEGKYSYYAYEDQEAYLLFAYDDKKVLDLLAEIGISSEQINKVYFAQSEFQDAEQAISIDEDCVLDVQDRVVVKVPDTLVSSLEPLQLEDHDFSEHAIELDRYTHIATKKSLLQFAVFMGTLISIFALDWTVSMSKVSEFDASPLELYAEHNLPTTKVQNEAILSRLQKQYEKQIKIRQLTAEILNLKLQKSEYIRLYDLNEKKLSVEMKLASSQRASDLSKLLKRQYHLLKEEYKKGILRLEFEL
jgi:hypothetical protein